nr:glycosyltransferase family 2 protein [uncultured Flavobacterium sp.]
MIQNKPKVTIVTVVYNDIDSIEETILSVINQDYNDKEYIIIDGGSTDGTIEIIKKYETRIDYWISEKDKGIYDAMNKGIIIANGEWVNFMNSGDYFFDHTTLSTIFSNISIDSGIHVLYGSVCYFINNKLIVKLPKSLNRIQLGMPICHQSMLTRAAFLKSQLFDLKYKFASDYDQFYKIHNDSPKGLLNTHCTISRITVNGFSESNSIGTYLEYKSISRKYNKDFGIRLYFVYRLTERVLVKYIKKIISVK